MSFDHRPHASAGWWNFRSTLTFLEHKRLPQRLASSRQPGEIDVLAQSLGGEIASLRASKAELFDLQRWVVERSPLFDAEWYLLTYPDAKASGLDPVVHYVMFGARELRNPSANFDTAAYL